MYTTADAKFLNVEERSFKNDRGENVVFHRLSVLDLPELNPVTLPCTESVFSRIQAQNLPKLSDLSLYLSIVPRQNSVRVRVEDFTA